MQLKDIDWTEIMKNFSHAEYKVEGYNHSTRFDTIYIEDGNIGFSSPSNSHVHIGFSENQLCEVQINEISMTVIDDENFLKYNCKLSLFQAMPLSVKINTNV